MAIKKETNIKKEAVSDKKPFAKISKEEWKAKKEAEPKVWIDCGQLKVLEWFYNQQIKTRSNFLDYSTLKIIGETEKAYQYEVKYKNDSGKTQKNWIPKSQSQKK